MLHIMLLIIYSRLRFYKTSNPFVMANMTSKNDYLKQSRLENMLSVKIKTRLKAPMIYDCNEDSLLIFFIVHYKSQCSICYLLVLFLFKQMCFRWRKMLTIDCLDNLLLRRKNGISMSMFVVN